MAEREKKIADSFKRYSGNRNRLILMTMEDSPTGLFKSIRTHPCVSQKSLHSVLAELPQSETPPPLANVTTSSDEDKEVGYTQAQLSGVKKLQHLWRIRLAKISKYRTYVSSPSGQVFKHYWTLCSRHKVRADIRVLLAYLAPITHMKINGARQLVERQNERTMRLIESADPAQSEFGALDGILQRVIRAEVKLTEIAEGLSKSLKKVIESGDVGSVKGHILGIKRSVIAVEGEIREAEGLLDKE